MAVQVGASLLNIYLQRMSGLDFSGLYYLHKPFADRMAGIIVPRLNAGQAPIPSLLQANGLAAAADRSDEDARRERWMQRSRAQDEMYDEVYDEEGNFDRERYDLYRYRRAGGGSVAVIPIDGPMARVGYCGIGGNEYLGRILQLAQQNPKVKAAIFKTDTPGGTVDSTRALADQATAFTKPLLTWTNFCCSAGYYVASQTDEIWIEDQTVSRIGSIGVLMVYVDQSKALEKEGYQVTIYRADGSDKKALLNGVEPLSKETEAQILIDLNDCRTEFLGYVKRGRAGKLRGDEKEMFSGEVFGPEKALTLGLADQIGSLQACIQRALQLAA